MRRKRKATAEEYIVSFYILMGTFFLLSIFMEFNEGMLITGSSLVAMIVIQILISRKKKKARLDYIQRLQASDMAAVDSMTGREFELYLEVLFQKLGYGTEQLPTTNDFGADLILVNGDKRIAVQAKRYKGNVGNRAVQMIIGAKRYYGCNEAWIVTNSFYTKAAIQMSEKTDVLLVDRNGLLDLMTKSKTLP